MSGPYTRGADLARAVVEASQARTALLTDAATLLEDLRREPADTAADILLVWLDAAGSYGRIAESRAERARRSEAQEPRSTSVPLTGRR